MMTSSLLCVLLALLPQSGTEVSNEASTTAQAIFLAEQIDRYVTEKAAQTQLSLPPTVDDNLYLRRISLDLLGRIPTLQELRDFQSLGDRQALVRQMLESEEHHRFWSRFWTNTLLGFGPRPQTDREALRGWLEKQFASSTSFDVVVRELISAQGRGAFEGQTNFVLQHGKDAVVPLGRIFLGVQLDCARCHDHPYDRWSESDFAGMQRFFELAQRRQTPAGTYVLSDRRPGQVAEDDRPRFLTGSRVRTQSWRQELGLLVTNSKPFRRATANRLWYHFFGHGLSEEVDNINGASKSPDFGFVQELSQSLEQNAGNWRVLVEAICISSTYQRATGDHQSPLLPSPKPLSPDQLYDSIALLSGGELDVTRDQFLRSSTGVSQVDSFTNTWDNEDRPQALMSRMRFSFSSSQDIDELFESVLSRRPSALQTKACEGYRPEDVLFALVHSNEFMLWY